MGRSVHVPSCAHSKLGVSFILGRRMTMRGVCSFIAVLLLTVYVSAQQPTSPSVGRASSCPIALHVQIDGRAIAQSASDRKNGGDGALLNLNFGAKGSLKVMAAIITVHGSGPSGRYQPVGHQVESSDSLQVVELGQEGGAPLVSREVRVRFPLVSQVELTELRYADGTIWHSSADANCIVSPSHLVLVDAVAQPHD